jgi:hypothetical protein
MWWIATAFAQEAPEEHLVAWRRDEDGGRIESIWVEPDGNVHRVDGFVTVVDGEVLKWASLPYTRFVGAPCNYTARGEYCLELDQATREVLVRVGASVETLTPPPDDGVNGNHVTSVWPIAQLGPWLFLDQRWMGDDGRRPHWNYTAPVYDLKNGSTMGRHATLAFVEADIVAAALVQAKAQFLLDEDFVAPDVPREPEPKRILARWDERGHLVTELVFEIYSCCVPPNDLTGSGYVEAVRVPTPDTLEAWAAPPPPVASFLAGRTQAGWSASEVGEWPLRSLRAIFDVPPPDPG